MIAPSRSRYRVAIVGAGIVGLYTAYHLARAGAGPILVLDRGFLSGGASGRNGGGVRQQWETPATVRLAREAVGAWRRFGADVGYNVWFRQGGYLFLAESEAELARLRAVHAVVTREGLSARLLSAEAVGDIAPAIDRRRVTGATFLSTDGVLYPFPAIWALAERLRALGVEVRLGVEATGLSTEAGRATGLTTSVGAIAADRVVNAAGGWASEFSARCGLPSPNRPTRHEILATEALRPFLGPMVIRLSDGLYVSQTMRGELVGGVTIPHPDGLRAGMASAIEFLPAMARALLSVFPRLGPLRVLRAWSGYYDETPDGLPVIGEDPRCPGYVHANGFGGHGFMLAPASSRRVAWAVLGEKSDLDPAEFGPGRFLGPNAPRTAERLQPG
jgi:sarcosine oxidase, subunit beta